MKEITSEPEQQSKACDCSSCELRSLFFEHVAEGDLRTVCSLRKEESFEKGDIIISEGDEIRYFLYLKSGLVKLFRNGNDGKQQIIKIARPYDFVSMLSVFSETRFKYSVTALEDSTVCYVSLKMIRGLALSNGKFALDLLERMSKTSDDIITTSLEIHQKNLHGRIAYLLIYFSRYIYMSEQFDLPLSRKEIADFIGMTTENVIRTLSEFRKDNIIRINGKTIEILDIGRLEKILNFG